MKTYNKMIKIKFSDIRLTHKIILGYTLVGISVVLIVAYSVSSFVLIDRQEKELIRITDARKTARSLDVDVLRIIVDLQYYARTEDPKLLENLAVNRAESDKLRNDLRHLTTLPEVINLLDKYEAILTQRRSSGNSIIKAVQSDEPDEVIRRLEAERRTLDDEVRGYLREIIRLEEQASKNQQMKTEVLINNVKKNLVIIVVPLITIIIIVITLIVRSIKNPMEKLNQMIEQVGSGNFNFRNNIDSNDELGRLAKTINFMAADLARLDQAKEEFIALASHQLRTPATAVKNFIGLLKEGYAGEMTKEQKEYVDFAYDSNEQQLLVINDLLRVARSDSGRVVLNIKSVNLEKLTKSVIDQQLSTFAERNQTCKLLGTDHATDIMADEEYLRMAVENLISNASKYTKPGGNITVTIEIEENDITLSVKDTGVGIEQSDIKKLFVKFSRIPNELSHVVGGSGIGLYLTKQIVDLHHGHIAVESNINKGTTFTIKLPREGQKNNG